MEKPRSVDLALWLLAGIMAIVLLLATPKLGADSTGRTVVVVLLVLVFLFVVHPVWNLERIRGSRLRFWCALAVIAIALSAFGRFVWPFTLTVDPPEITYSRQAFNETFSASITNRSDVAVYRALFALHVENKTVSPGSFGLSIARSSQKPIGDSGAAAKLADVMLFSCREQRSQEPVFLFLALRLSGHESREVTITGPVYFKGRVRIEPVSSETDPHPLGMGSEDVYSDFNIKGGIRPPALCRILYFFLGDQRFEGPEQPWAIK